MLRFQWGAVLGPRFWCPFCMVPGALAWIGFGQGYWVLVTWGWGAMSGWPLVPYWSLVSVLLRPLVWIIALACGYGPLYHGICRVLDRSLVPMGQGPRLGGVPGATGASELGR